MRKIIVFTVGFLIFLISAFIFLSSSDDNSNNEVKTSKDLDVVYETFGMKVYKITVDSTVYVIAVTGNGIAIDKHGVITK